MVSWVEALKEYAKKTGKYVVPKKGSAEYEAVRKIMSDGGSAPAAEAPVEKKPRKPRAKKVLEKEGELNVKITEEVKEKKPRKRAAKKVETPKAEEEVKEKKPRKRAAKVVDVKSANAMDAKPRRGRRKAEAGSIPAGLNLTGGETAKAVERQKNPEAVLEQATNAHLPVNPSNVVPKLRLPKSTAYDSKIKLEAGAADMPALVDKEPIHNEAPFDFKALRRTLGA